MLGSSIYIAEASWFFLPPLHIQVDVLNSKIKLSSCYINLLSSPQTIRESLIQKCLVICCMVCRRSVCGVAWCRPGVDTRQHRVHTMGHRVDTWSKVWTPCRTVATPLYFYFLISSLIISNMHCPIIMTTQTDHNLPLEQPSW